MQPLLPKRKVPDHGQSQRKNHSRSKTLLHDYHDSAANVTNLAFYSNHVIAGLIAISKQKHHCWTCCNLSGGVALIVWFTTNGMCAKNKNICMWRGQAIIEWSRWSDLGEWPNNACEPGKQFIVLANGDNESDLVRWSLLLLAATVQSFAYMPLGISDRNRPIATSKQKHPVVLWPNPSK